MITQRLILDGGYPDGIWTCPGCHGPLTSGVIQHPDDCPELRRGNAAGPLPSVAQVEAWLKAHGWVPERPGPAGGLWRPAAHADDAVAVLNDSECLEFPASLERIAKASSLPFGTVLASMRAMPSDKCEFCGEHLVRLTVRWLTADSLSDHCDKSPTRFHNPSVVPDA